MVRCNPRSSNGMWGVARGSSISWVAKLKGDEHSGCKLSNGWLRSYRETKPFLRRRTNVQQLTCNIDLSSSFYYLFFSFVLLELKPFVFKWKVLGEKFWKSAKKCEKSVKIMKRFCPLVVALEFFPDFFLPKNERSQSYREINQHPDLPSNSITHGSLDPIRASWLSSSVIP